MRQSAHLIDLGVVGVDPIAADLLRKVKALGHDGPRLGAADVQPPLVCEGRLIRGAQDASEVCLADAAGCVCLLQVKGAPLEDALTSSATWRVLRTGCMHNVCAAQNVWRTTLKASHVPTEM
jgi:hypothetical protein